MEDQLKNLTEQYNKLLEDKSKLQEELNLLRGSINQKAAELSKVQFRVKLVDEQRTILGLRKLKAYLAGYD